MKGEPELRLVSLWGERRVLESGRWTTRKHSHGKATDCAATGME